MLIENEPLSKRKRHFFIGKCCFFSTSSLMHADDVFKDLTCRQFMYPSLTEIIFIIRKIGLLRCNIFSQYKIYEFILQNILFKSLISND